MRAAGERDADAQLGQELADEQGDEEDEGEDDTYVREGG